MEVSISIIIHPLRILVIHFSTEPIAEMGEARYGGVSAINPPPGDTVLLLPQGDFQDSTAGMAGDPLLEGMVATERLAHQKNETLFEIEPWRDISIEVLAETAESRLAEA